VTTRLEELAQLKGIALAYEDVWGETHRASAQTLVELLRAMRVAAQDEAAIEASIAAHEADRWRHALPAAWVIGANAPAELPLRLREADASLTWRVVEEGGPVHEGGCRSAELREVERATLAGTDCSARALPLPALPPGYHGFGLLQGEAVLAHSLLIVAPPCCYLPRALEGEGRVWGAAAQLYAVRSERNWGIGDFTDLAALLELMGTNGASVVGVNPLHAKFPHNPVDASPYSPSSRLFLNTLYLDVESIDDFRESEATRALVRDAAFQARLHALRAADRVDYAGVAALEQPVLERLHEHFRTHHLAHGTPRAQAFHAFCDARGAALQRHALFEALQEHFHREDPAVWGWPAWPEAFRSPDAPAVQRFAHEHAERVGFYAWLQWQAELQLDAVGRRSLELGLGVGLYADLAVSVDRAGAEAWAAQDLYATGASVGAPPDAFNLKGQDWGLPPPIPQRLAQAAYAPFIETLRANMRHAGALRIDHVMALMRLYWVPAGADAASGGYVRYPFDELLAILRLESQRNRCAVIGEDLGTVPQEVRDKLAASGVLSYRLLYFERDADGDFAPPARYPRQALVAASTHDLPTLAGWWDGADLALRTRLGLFPTPGQAQQQALERAGDRARLLLALERDGLLPPGASTSPASLPEMTPALARALHEYLARTPSMMVLAQLEDVLGVREQINQPGTVDAYPNWQRKLPLALEQWAGDERFALLARMFERERGPRRQAAPPRAQAIVPRATYRVQLHREFTFADATALVPYLARLGISHLYCSPFLRARAGSRHGYDVVDHDALNPEIGTRGELDRLVEALHEHGMGLLIDVVPNHMGVLGGDNAWWLDVLEDGQASSYAEFFDIDWRSADPALAGRVLLPILGDQYGVVLERGELRLEFEAACGRFTLVYFDHRLPIDPLAYAPLLRRAWKRLPASATQDGKGALERLAGAFERLPQRASDADAHARRRRDKTVLEAQLAQEVAEQPALARAIADMVVRMNGSVGQRASFDALDALIEAQAYRLAHWRVAADEINYRRFFDINELAALRMERAEVFEATHRLVLRLAAEGAVDGLRIDHPDGLADPAGYFERLQQRYAELAGVERASPAALPLYVVTEKITAPHEQLPHDWAVHGTTGYRFANVVNALMVDADAKARLDRAWRVFVRDEAADFDELSWRCRRLVMAGALSGELTVLATALLRLARADRRTRDFTLDSLRGALRDVVASFPVYRTYVIDKPSPQDRRFIDWAIGRARRRSLAADASVFDFLRRVLLGRTLPGAPADLADGYRGFARRLQQYTAPVAAKGIEDTALYRHHRLVSLNDVGGDPDMFGLSVAAFHAASRDRSLHWPHTMLATSTHDAKRSEDVRARIDVISEMPAAWRLTTRRWSRFNRRHKRIVGGVPAPTRNDEYLLYQTLAGSLPAGALSDAALADYAERVDAAMLKSAREAKTLTSWINPNAAYEAALSAFVRESLARREANLFLADLQSTVALLAWYGAFNGIAMATIKCLSPGVPDFYQGQETIELSLVDPDNRRPVDYARRRALLAQMEALAAQPERGAALRALLEGAPDGTAKFWAVWRALQLRRDREAMLRRAAYLPLEARGERARHVVAFARHDGARWVNVVATRLFASLGLRVGEAPVGAVWGDTAIELPAGDAAHALPAGTRLVDAMSGDAHVLERAELSLASLLRHFPVAVLDAAVEP
jgi:(1->4)-alpha-D-glucan 1-alpha-D-glucosylmutase